MRLEIDATVSAPPLTDEVDTVRGVDAAEVKSALNQGIKAAQGGDRAQARKSLLRATELDPRNESAWLWLASISEYPEELLGFLNNVLDINPENERASEWKTATHSLLSKTFVQRGIDASQETQKEFALECFHTALEYDERNAVAWMWIASLSDSNSEKISLLQKALDIEPENESALSALESAKAGILKQRITDAKSAAVAGNNSEALAILDDLLAVKPDSIEAWTMRSHLSESFDEKIRCFESILAIDPENVAAKAGRDSLLAIFGTAEAAYAESSKVSSEAMEEVAAYEEYTDGTAHDKSPTEELEMPDGWTEPAAADQHVETEFTPEETNENEHIARVSEPFATFAEEAPELIETEPTAASELTQPEADFGGYTPHPQSGVAFADLQPQAEPQHEVAFADLQPQAEPQHEVALADLQPQAEPQHEVAFADSQPHAEPEPEDPYADLDWEAEPEHESAYADPQAETVVFKYDTEAAYSEPAVEEVGEPVREETPWSQEAPDSPIMMPSVALPLDAPASAHDPAATFVERTEVPPIETPASEHDPAATYVEPTEVLTVKAETIECPFCLVTNDGQVISCGSCNAVLTLSDLELLLGNHTADTMRLRDAVEEMERQRLGREFSSEELVTLGLGHLNLRNFQLGYSCLLDASRMSPNNVVLGGQVNALHIRLEEIKMQEEAHLKMPKGKSILVVDDSPTVRKLIAGKLEKCGHTVICANDGIEAMERLEHFVPDLVLLDITMPRMDGYQVCKQIRSNEATKDVTVVMISGKDGFFDKVRGRMAGTTGYITKPFGPETLMKAVEMYLSGEAPELDEV